MLPCMNAYSKDLRLRVLAAVERGIPRREVAQLFGISLATIGRYIKRRAEDGQIAPKPSPGRRPKVLDTPEHKGLLWDQLRENDTATLEEHCRMWEESQGIRVSVATMSRSVRKLGWSFKKDRWHPPSKTSTEEVSLESR
jgi:transposase